MQRRPGFPAKLPGSATTPAGAPPQRSADLGTRPIAAMAVGVGLDSAAVRARMVQKLAAGGGDFTPGVAGYGPGGAPQVCGQCLRQPSL